MELGNFDTILAKESPFGLTVTLNRPERRNSLNALLIQELSQVLDIAEQNPEWKFVVLEGQQGLFCTGMDLESYAASALPADADAENADSSAQYMNLIRHFTLIPKIIISHVDGEVTAGGVGLAAASDLVIATPRSQFALSEALWGLLPAMVTPCLIRRIGFWNAYQMTLTTKTISAHEAYEMHLADEITESPKDSIRRLWLRLRRLDHKTVGNIKQYFRKMWIITEQTEKTAVSETSRLMADPGVRKNIENYVRHRKFPWEDENI